MIGVASLFVVCAVIYTARNFSSWSAANPSTRLALIPSSKKAHQPPDGDLRWRRQNMLMVAAGISAGGAYTSLSATHGHVYLAVIWTLAGWLPALAVAGYLKIRHNHRVKARQAAAKAH